MAEMQVATAAVGVRMATRETRESFPSSVTSSGESRTSSTRIRTRSQTTMATTHRRSLHTYHLAAPDLHTLLPAVQLGHLTHHRVNRHVLPISHPPRQQFNRALVGAPAHKSLSALQPPQRSVLRPPQPPSNKQAVQAPPSPDHRHQ